MSEPFLGQISVFAFSFPPNGWADCAGQLLPIRQYTALFSLLGTQFGGDGISTFGLPDLQGRVPLNQGQGPGLSIYDMGEMAGVENVALTSSEMPAHNHGLSATTAHGSTNTAEGGLLSTVREGGLAGATHGYIYNPASPDTTLAPQAIVPVGGSQPHNNLQPYLVLRYCIALTGVFPSRA